MIIWECIEAKGYLSAGVRGELSEPIKAELDRHVLDCSDCRGELELIEKFFILRPAAPLQLPLEIKKAVRLELFEVETSYWRKFLPAAAVTTLLVSASLLDKVLFLPDISLLEQDFFVNVWPSEDYDLAGSLVLDDFSEESLNLLFEEIK